MKNIICGVTGHTGSIGKNLIKKKKNFKFLYFTQDITKRKHVENWIENNNFDQLIHLAAIVPIKQVNKNKKKAFDVNVKGTKNLVNANLFAKKRGIKTITLTGCKPSNKLNKMKNNVNLWVNSNKYNVIEITHHLILLNIIDSIIKKKK